MLLPRCWMQEQKCPGPHPHVLRLDLKRERNNFSSREVHPALVKETRVWLVCLNGHSGAMVFHEPCVE